MIMSNGSLNCACSCFFDCPNFDSAAAAQGKDPLPQYCRLVNRGKTSVYTRRVLNLRPDEPVFKARAALSVVRRAQRREKKKLQWEALKGLLRFAGIARPYVVWYLKASMNSRNAAAAEMLRRETVSGKQKNDLAALAEKRMMDTILQDHERLLRIHEQRKTVSKAVAFLTTGIAAGKLATANMLLALRYKLPERDLQHPVWLSVRWTHTGIASIRD